MTHELAAWHALHFTGLIDEYLSGVTRASFEDDSLGQRAVTLRLQHVSAVTPWILLDLRAAHPEVRWAHIVASDDYLSQRIQPPVQRLWDDAQETIGAIRTILACYTTVERCKAAPGIRA